MPSDPRRGDKGTTPITRVIVNPVRIATTSMLADLFIGIIVVPIVIARTENQSALILWFWGCFCRCRRRSVSGFLSFGSSELCGLMGDQIRLILVSSLLPLCPLDFGDVSAQTDTSVSPMLATEREALYSLIQAFAGNSFNGSELYPDPCGWTPIQGFSCDLFDGLWYVTVVSIGPIHENSLECTPDAQLSHYIFEFKHLKSLSFFNCFHHPITIPSQNWEKFAGSLETLEFRLNPGITGEIPSSLGSLTKLMSLVLIENSLTGELPSSLGNLGGLKQLVLAENRFSGQIPASLGGLRELLILDFSRNFLSGPFPSTFGGLFSLLKLDLSSNLLDGKLPMELGQLRNLTLLDLRNNRFSGGLPPSLQEMVSLEEMLLENNPIGGNLVEHGWGQLKNLIILDLSNMSLTGKIPESMAQMKRLRFVALENNHLSVGSGHVPFGVKQCDEKASLSSTVLKAEVGRGNSNQGTIMAFDKVSEQYYELQKRLCSQNRGGKGMGGARLRKAGVGRKGEDFILGSSTEEESDGGVEVCLVAVAGMQLFLAAVFTVTAKPML
ncbi:hypothetical protein MRB53_024445 [Persea americana]|uniref:Uncharacterized protein n=1 Tax=Persea americana TaxID=3435 RepID=A0ACC2LC82_PERAE|nr:hypothetical protein MRB53_024445 [Persea americana]